MRYQLDGRLTDCWGHPAVGVASFYYVATRQVWNWRKGAADVDMHQIAGLLRYRALRDAGTSYGAWLRGLLQTSQAT